MAEVNMRGLTMTVSQELVTEQCCTCGVVFAMTKEFKQQCRDNPGVNTGKPFYCPAGHPQYYTGETEAAKLRRERDQLKQQMAHKEDMLRSAWNAEQAAREDAEHQKRRANGYKGHAARITKRAKSGLCPCCNRHFTALERHMATKHPEFTPDCPEPLRVIEGGKVA